MAVVLTVPIIISVTVAAVFAVVVIVGVAVPVAVVVNVIFPVTVAAAAALRAATLCGKSNRMLCFKFCCRSASGICFGTPSVLNDILLLKHERTGCHCCRISESD